MWRRSAVGISGVFKRRKKGEAKKRRLQEEGQAVMLLDVRRPKAGKARQDGEPQAVTIVTGRPLLASKHATSSGEVLWNVCEDVGDD